MKQNERPREMESEKKRKMRQRKHINNNIMSYYINYHQIT